MNRKELGDWGEEKACAYLRGKGFLIIERNFRCLRGEIDIVAIKGDKLCFIEVKTRTSVRFGLPCQAVDSRKQVHMKRAADFFLMTRPQYQQLCPGLDIIEILSLPNGRLIRYLPDAF
jgi:putative endonuclease